MKSLILHCGGQVKSRDEVFAIPVPPATGRSAPIPHELLLTHLDERLAIEGFKPRGEQLALTQNGQRLFGLMELQWPISQDRTYGCVLGLRNSYDRSFAPGLCAGAMVFVCDNLGFYGSHLQFQARQTADLLEDLPSVIGAVVARLPGLFAAQSTALDRYRRTRLDDQTAQDLAVRFFDEGGLAAVDLPRLISEWQAPRHREFCQEPTTAWRLLNAATEILKGDLWSLPEKTFAIHRVLDQACSIRPITDAFTDKSFHSTESFHPGEPATIGHGRKGDDFL